MLQLWALSEHKYLCLAAVPATAFLAGAAELVSSVWMGQAAVASTASGELMGSCVQHAVCCA